jgi:exoribonuclease R
MCDWIPGTLELTSKVRYGITSRGVPIFRFIPYDKRHRPLAVSCSQRNLFYNIHAIVQPGPAPEKGELQKGVLIQNLGQPTTESEVAILLGNYAYDCQKELRPSKHTKEGACLTTLAAPDLTKRTVLEGFTFNIDPPGCRDVDDSFTLKQIGQEAWQVSINIADVASLIEEGSDLDIQARRRATSFYSPTGECLAPMFPPEVSEGAASLGSDEPRPALSLQFVYCYENGISDFQWAETTVTRSRSFTYDEADALLHNCPELKVIKDITMGANSHEWVQKLMILYNQKAGEALKARGLGVLRSHSAPKAEELAELTAIDPSFGILAYEAATFCLPSDDSKHFGLDADAYAYASSPIRRYCDLVNQRALKGLATVSQPEEFVYHLNRRQKQAKAFSRDFFFMTELSNSKDAVEGTVIGKGKVNSKCKVYVPVWKRTIKVRLLDTTTPPPGTKVSIEWYDDRGQPNWKERIVFRIR